MDNKFGQLVKVKLFERGMSQRRLAILAHSSPAHISYIISGTNPSSKRGRLQPGVDVVKAIARELDIPIDEALEAAGHDPERIRQADARAAATPDTDQRPANITPPSDAAAIFDIAYKAALAAVNEAEGKVVASPDQVTIEVPGKILVTLLAAGSISENGVNRYTEALEAAYDAVTTDLSRSDRHIDTDQISGNKGLV